MVAISARKGGRKHNVFRYITFGASPDSGAFTKWQVNTVPS